MRGSCFHEAFPTRRVSGIDGIENKRNSFFQLWRLRHTKRNRGVTNFIFRADELLAHSCTRDEKPAAIRAASTPRTVRNINGVCAEGSNVGGAQTTRIVSRSSRK